MKIFKVSYKTIYNWYERWELEGMVGLYNKPGRDSKRIFNSEEESKIREWGQKKPKQLKKVLQKVKEEWGIEVSTETIKRILKKFSQLLAPPTSRSRRRARTRGVSGKKGTVRRIQTIR
jgi:transposase